MPQRVVLGAQLGIADGVAPFDLVVFLAMQEQVHLGQRPGGADGLLPIERIALAAAVPDQPAAFHQEGGRPTGRITDVIPWLRVGQTGHEVGDLGRGIELPRLLARRGREAGDQIFIGPTNDVELPDTRRAQVQRGFGEVLQQVAEDIVLLFLVAQLVGVEADVLEHVAEFVAVGLFDGMEGLVDAFAIACFMPPFVQGLEAGPVGQLKCLLLHHRLDQFRAVGVFGLIAGIVILPHVTDVFEEQQGEHVVLVDRWIDDPPERVARPPCGFVDFMLRNRCCGRSICNRDHCGLLSRRFRTL